MRILIAVAFVLAMLNTPAAAFFGRTFNERWCLGFNEELGGTLDCRYYTWEQCEAAQSGDGGACIENPAWSIAERRYGPKARRRWH